MYEAVGGAVLGLAASLVLVGCDSATAGQPRATDTTEEPTTSAAEEYSLARLCELISADESQQLGGSAEGEKKNSASDGHELCAWSDATYLAVGFQDGTSTAAVAAGEGITNTPTTIDGLTAVQSLKTEPTAICEVMVDLPSGKMFTSAVTVLSAGEGRYEACQVATELSNLVIPRVKDQ